MLHVACYMFVVVGLGNPGSEYENTRHNTGAFLVDTFRKYEEFPDWNENKKKKSLISEGKVGKERVLLVFPQTFMNKSADAVRGLVTSAKKAETLVVVHDDLDLPIGRFKISFNKSAGGHRGVASISNALKTDAYVRVRVGISPAGAKGKLRKPEGEKAVIDHILGKWKPAELAALKKLSKKASEAIETIITAGREKAMGEFNKAS